MFWVHKLLKWGEKSLGGGLCQSYFLLWGGTAFSLLSYFPKGTHQGITPTETPAVLLPNIFSDAILNYSGIAQVLWKATPLQTPSERAPRSLRHAEAEQRVSFCGLSWGRGLHTSREALETLQIKEGCALSLHASSEWRRRREHCGGTTSTSNGRFSTWLQPKPQQQYGLNIT